MMLLLLDCGLVGCGAVCGKKELLSFSARDFKIDIVPFVEREIFCLISCQFSALHHLSKIIESTYVVVSGGESSLLRYSCM